MCINNTNTNEQRTHSVTDAKHPKTGPEESVRMQSCSSFRCWSAPSLHEKETTLSNGDENKTYGKGEKNTSRLQVSQQQCPCLQV